jgi:hypothetical protein
MTMGVWITSPVPDSDPGFTGMTDFGYFAGVIIWVSYIDITVGFMK